MAKILISPLGVGGRFKGTSQSEREYRPAQYVFEDQYYPESRFVASVLYKHLQIDSIIFIGTVKSMWEEVYRFFCEEKLLSFDQDYWFDLAKKIDQLDHKSSLEEIDLSSVEAVLGNRSKCLLIRYGLTEDEIWLNLEKIVEAIQELQEGDEVYLDITHSFRSLSIFQFLSVLLIYDLFPEKQIKISGVYYGMLDVSSEFDGKTPIINLMPLFDMAQWIKGIYNLNQFGNGYLIANLLRDRELPDLARRIEDFSDVVNINYLSNISQKATDLRSGLNQNLPTPLSYLKPEIDRFTRNFFGGNIPSSKLQLQVAKWYFENRRYATGYITLAEALITYACELENKDSTVKDYRDRMKEALHGERQNTDLARLFFKVNPIRTAIAHARIDKQLPSYQSAINQAQAYIQDAEKIFLTGTFSMPN
ncbi:TIGR02221 family CRISPR-associated protein [Trichothermofontia sp.]